MTVRGVFRNVDKTQSVAEGEVVFAEGEEGDHMYGVVEGTVELRKGDKVVTSIGEGNVFGEMALIDRSPRSLTAVAASPVELAVIDRRTFLFLIHETPTFALEVMSSLAALLRAYDEKL